MVALGVREDESKNRQGRDVFSVRARKKEQREHRSLGHTFAMFKLDQVGGEDAYQCKMIEACKNHKDTIVNPIYHLTEKDILEYIKTYDVKINPLYAEGFSRVGCVGCPLAGPQKMQRDFARWPKYKENYIKAFDRMIVRRQTQGKKCPWATGKEVMRWWLGENPKQIRIEDILNDETGD